MFPCCPLNATESYAPQKEGCNDSCRSLCRPGREGSRLLSTCVLLLFRCTSAYSEGITLGVPCTLPEQLTILVTGATDGLGLEVATDLAGKGSTLLLHGRDPDKGERVVAQIRETTGNSRNPASQCRPRFPRPSRSFRPPGLPAHGSDWMCCIDKNAGLGGGPDPSHKRPAPTAMSCGSQSITSPTFSSPGSSCRFSAELRRRPERPASSTWRQARQRAIDFGDVMLEKSYSGMAAYSQSKLAQVMFTFDLAEELGGDRG